MYVDYFTLEIPTYSIANNKLFLLTCPSQAVTVQEAQQLPLDCAASTLPDDNARRDSSTIPAQSQSSSKPQSKQQKAKRVRQKKSQKQKVTNSQVAISSEDPADVNKAIADSFVLGLIKI